ncbi:uncharacterized protein YcaC [Aspergillus udagawae]|uniref:Uncharacterized protein YcaC n=1 Tax=Aspergillus udagawae TaxID=91492 RepID=A0A8H3XMJ3_9EURO|nr:uncharacterized protein Aud_002742 [Aspergillus udagawae]GFF35792.1 uncharacterized protein YcaC [Aspergillus udagawae]GFF52930.1 uncharacterized protein YcaC [Aspergillus udagawae]GFF95219.1 uncharacterized protein YcaC [Aspergillus udagawae]GFG14758.1 uncharacterized protein YcaC [Aspergillus udagawae]GFG26242.1 uncharacterized protein YcaC [Aspergillus udagawae]
MRFIRALQTVALLAASTTVMGWNRLDKENAAVLVIDYQVGLAQLVRDFNTNDFRNNMLAHAALGNLFDLPVVMTTSSDAGPNGLMIKEVVDLNPNVTIVHRQGEVNAWDNAEFRAAVKATGKKQLIIGGIVTEVCTAFLALSLIDEGYEVFANTEASGTFDVKLAADANRRMEKAGVTLMGTFGVVTDLMRDWRNTPGLDQVLPYLDKYQYAYGLVARHHAGAIENGTLAAVESTLI